jgi:hypothetical protein
MSDKKNSGLCNSGLCNSGLGNYGYWNSGGWNKGNYNAGCYNYGDKNSGWRNSGYRNSGDNNSGDKNSGYRNSGNWNSGGWNKGNGVVGYCNTVTPDTILAFNKPCAIEDWDAADKPYWMYFEITEWIDIKYMSKQEQLDHTSCKTTGGYLKVYKYQEAARMSWNKTSDEDKLKIYKLPNFDAKVAQEIFGIDFDEYLESKNKRI